MHGEKVLESVKGCRAWREVCCLSSCCSPKIYPSSSGCVDCHVVGRIVFSVVLAVKDRANNLHQRANKDGKHEGGEGGSGAIKEKIFDSDCQKFRISNEQGLFIRTPN